LRLPTNCFTDPADGTLYVADVDRRQVVVFDSTLAYRGAFGEQEEARPTDVFVDEEHVWVADPAGDRAIRVYDKSDFRYLRSFPEPGAESPAKLFFPTHLWVQGDEVYVTDFGDFMVKVYSRDGEFLRTVGSYGRGMGQFVRPKGIAVDRDGILYVVDAGFQNVQMFNSDGAVLMFFGGEYGGPGGMWLPAKVTIAYSGLELFEPFVQPGYRLEYLILVSNQFGPDLINVYGFIKPAGVGGDEAP
jgi:DNA-binding beta-propeller fold protein YncE